MAGGKLNWQRSDKEERLAKYGGVDVDDESILPIDKPSKTPGTSTDKMVECPHCSWRVQALLLNEHLLESHGIVGNPFRCLLSAFLAKNERPFVDLLVKDMEERWMARPRDGTLMTMLVELMYRTSGAAKVLAATAFTMYLVKHGIDYQVSAESSRFSIMTRQSSLCAFRTRDFRSVIEWFDTEWEKGRFKKTAATTVVSQAVKKVEKPVPQPPSPAPIGRSATTPPVAKPDPKVSLHRELVTRLMSYQGRDVKGAMKIAIEQNPNGTFTVWKTVDSYRNLQCANASVEAALAVVERLVK